MSTYKLLPATSSDFEFFAKIHYLAFAADPWWLAIDGPLPFDIKTEAWARRECILFENAGLTGAHYVKVVDEEHGCASSLFSCP